MAAFEESTGQKDVATSKGSTLPVEHVAVKWSDLEPVILPRLIGTVFHVTSERAFGDILACGMISSNQDGRLQFTFPQSENNYGRQRGYVCLFDLRDVPGETVRDVLSVKFNFLKPTSADPVFLFLDRSEYPHLVPWTDAPVGTMVIPYVEAWYPRDVPVAALTHALAITVEEDDLDSAYRGVVRRLKRDKEELLDTGLVNIEAHTVEELRQRAEVWVKVAGEGGGLEVNLGWDEARVVRTAAGFGISLHAIRGDDWVEEGSDPD